MYPPSRIVGDSSANENSPFQLGLESSRIPGLYKPAVPGQQQDTPARTFRVKNSGSGTSSPLYLLPCTKPFSGRPTGSSITGPTREAGEALRSGSGIVYPLLPRAHRPDTSVTVDAAIPGLYKQGLYKPAVPGQQQDTPARTFRVKNSGSGTSSPPYLIPCTKPFSGRPTGSSITGPTREAGEGLRSRSGIVYPLLPRAHRPDTSVTVDAALPEPAAFQRQDLPPTVVEIGSPQPAPDAPCFQATRFQEVQQKTPTQPLYCSIPAIQALTSSWALV